MPTPTPSRGTPVEADEQPAFVDDAPTRPEPLVGALPIEPEAARPEAAAPPSSFVKRMLMRLRKQWPYALVLLTMAYGLFRTVQYHWREGSAWIGGALLLAAVLRAVLPPRTAGMVAVRGRFVDVLWCVGLAACILFIAYTLKA
ncbi:MAG TPA: DUF3017 domain-containing protein [Pseudonocardiaceae bacterium]|nr:DUF3017 domain-containing protein [Pseudonocardiaceae bacterium]